MWKPSFCHQPYWSREQYMINFNMDDGGPTDMPLPFIKWPTDIKEYVDNGVPFAADKPNRLAPITTMIIITTTATTSFHSSMRDWQNSHNNCVQTWIQHAINTAHMLHRNFYKTKHPRELGTGTAISMALIISRGVARTFFRGAE